jgi:hypothetical protein
MRVVQTNPIQGLFWIMEKSPLILVSMSTEAGILLTQQPIDPHCTQLPGLLLELLHHHRPDILVQPKFKPFSTLKGSYT